MRREGAVSRWAAAWVFVLTVASIGLLGTPLPAYAQDAVPTIEDAELVFEQGLQAFEEADFGMAYRRFRLVYSTYEINRKTTAAVLMAAKSLYRDGRYEDAVDLAQTLIDEFPTSSYVDDARRLQDRVAEESGRIEHAPEVRELGIMLPLQAEDATLTQALFTGVRIAVEEHNRLQPSDPIRMVFRDTQADPDRAARVVSDLENEGAAAIIGPLYSREAVAAAEAAEENEIVLVAPLANNESVSENRDYVFQANPTITTRGRLMARFAMRGLLLDNFGVVAERDRDQISERMAEGFQEEAILSGEEVHYFTVVESQRDWTRLGEIVGRDTLTQARAVYIPIAGGETVARMDAALATFDRLGLANQIRVLGNTEWHNAPNPSRASRYETTYTNDFYVDQNDASVRAFMARFEEIIGERPEPSATIGRLAFTGYDVARYLIPILTSASDESLRQRIHAAPAYQGLGIRIDFSGGNVNEALYYFKYQDGRQRLLR